MLQGLAVMNLRYITAAFLHKLERVRTYVCIAVSLTPPTPQIPSWLAEDLEDARHNPTSPLSPASPLSPTSPFSPVPIPLGLPVIVGQGSISNGPLAAILTRPSQQHPPTRQQPTLWPPRHRSISSETVLVPAKPHPQQLIDPSLLPPSGASTPGVKRYPSENILTPSQDVGVTAQFERVQRREAKGVPPFGSPHLPATPSYWGTGGRTSGPPQGIGKGEPPGQLKLPSIVNSSHQADPLLLSNHRSKSGSQVMSPTFIKKFNSGIGWARAGEGGVERGGVRELFRLSVIGGQPKKTTVGVHGWFPRRQSVPFYSIRGRLPRQSVSDSATTDDDVAMTTLSHAWEPVDQSSGMPASVRPHGCGAN